MPISSDLSYTRTKVDSCRFFIIYPPRSIVGHRKQSSSNVRASIDNVAVNRFVPCPGSWNMSTSNGPACSFTHC